MIKHKIKYSFFATLAVFFGGKKLRNKKLMTGIILLSSISSLISCNSGKKTTCYIETIDTTLNNDTIQTMCYEKIDTPDTSSNIVQEDTSNIEDEILCYKVIIPEEKEKKEELPKNN